jgi:sulfotransferase
MNKNYYFLCGLPRSGNTLLASLINQNKDICLGANSILAGVIYELNLFKNSELFKNFQDEISLNNIIKEVFNNYYKHFKANNIIIRAPWGTPANLYMLKEIIKEPKFIIIYRPVLECLSSIIKLENPKDIKKRCEEIMSEEGVIGKNLWSIKNIIESKEKYIVFKYDDLISEAEKTIKNMCLFLNIKYKKINVKNIKQLSINNIYYDDTILNADYHKLRTKSISKIKYKIKDILPDNIIKLYSNLDIL